MSPTLATIVGGLETSLAGSCADYSGYTHRVNRRLLRPSLLVLGAAPFALVALGGRLLVPRVADSLACRLAHATSVVAREPEGEEAHAADPVADRVVARHVPHVVGSGEGAASAAPGVRGGLPAARRETPRRLIALSRDRLSRLTARQLRGVGWATVVDAQGRAAGVRLSGVGGLGVGLADGDVVTSIDGRPTRTEDEARSAGSAAWASGAPSVRATIIRGGDTIAVTLELPAGARSSSER
jgi:hypothetical protein